MQEAESGDSTAGPPGNPLVAQGAGSSNLGRQHTPTGGIPIGHGGTGVLNSVWVLLKEPGRRGSASLWEVPVSMSWLRYPHGPSRMRVSGQTCGSRVLPRADNCPEELR